MTGALIRRGRDIRGARTQKNNPVKRQQEGSYLQVKDRSFRGNHPANTLNLDF